MALARAQSDKTGAAAVTVALVPGDHGSVVVALRGEHDLATVDTVSEVLAGAIASDDADLVVDLSEVEFMDASTVGVLSRCRALLRQRSRTMTLWAPSPPAQWVLDLCGITTLEESRPGSPPRQRGNPEAEDARS